jgi:hypothetical protein
VIIIELSENITELDWNLIQLAEIIWIWIFQLKYPRVTMIICRKSTMSYLPFQKSNFNLIW